MVGDLAGTGDVSGAVVGFVVVVVAAASSLRFISANSFWSFDSFALSISCCFAMRFWRICASTLLRSIPVDEEGVAVMDLELEMGEEEVFVAALLVEATEEEDEKVGVDEGLDREWVD